MNPLALFQVLFYTTVASPTNYRLSLMVSLPLSSEVALVACIIATNVTIATTFVTNPFTLCLVTKVVSNGNQLCTYLSDILTWTGLVFVT